MIFSTISPEQKKKINRLILGLGVLCLLVGIIPGFLPYQWGIVLFVFSFVIAGIVKIIIPDPDPNEPSSAEESHVEKVLKKTDETDKQQPEQFKAPPPNEVV